MKKSVAVVLFNKKGEVLAVSRKYDHNDFALVGGKVDPEDNDDTVKAAIRETKEETGLDIYNLKMIAMIPYQDRLAYCYIADIVDESAIKYDEPHVVKWTNYQTVIDGSFGDYNKIIETILDLLEINYIK